MNAVVDGSCLCGAVGYACTLPTKWVAHCHCSLCRRAHGAAFVTWAGLPDAQFRVTTGESQLRWYRSLPEAERGFCATCGSTLLFRSSKWPGEMHVVVSNLHAALDRAPQVHVNWNSHVDWYVPDDALPKNPSVQPRRARRSPRPCASGFSRDRRLSRLKPLPQGASRSCSGAYLG